MLACLQRPDLLALAQHDVHHHVDVGHVDRVIIVDVGTTVIFASIFLAQHVFCLISYSSDSSNEDMPFFFVLILNAI